MNYGPLRPRSRDRGFTLLEVLFAAGISSVVVMAVVTSFVIAQRTTMQSFWQGQVYADARTTVDNLVRDIRGAIEVESSFTHSASGVTYTTGDDTIILKLPAIDASEYIIDVESTFDRIVYSMSDSDPPVLLRRILPDDLSGRPQTTEVIGDLVNGFGYTGSFSTKPDPLGAFVLHYELKAQRTTGILGDFEMPLSGSVRLRNRPIAAGS